MRDHPGHDRARDQADPRDGGRRGGHQHAGRRVGVGDEEAGGYPPPVRLNRYLAAAGLGTRREVEGYVRQGRVAVDGTPAEGPGRGVRAGETVTLDGEPLAAPPTAGAVLHKPAHRPIALVHPPGLTPVRPLLEAEAGLELLLADRSLARRVADPRHPPAERREGGRRTRLAGFDLGELAPGTWRPLAPRELEALRRSVRLPPRV